MAVLLEVSWRDVNKVPASNRVSVDDAAAAATLLAKLKTLSNAEIEAAYILTPLDISGLAGNVAAANNVETAKTKMKITMSGPIPAGATARPTVTLGIPAPKGTYINGLEGDPTNADITALLTDVVSNRGETLNTVERVAYGR